MLPLKLKAKKVVRVEEITYFSIFKLIKITINNSQFALFCSLQ
jgi:hypothetical protein